MRYVYDSNGALEAVENDSDPLQIYWKAQNQAAAGGLTEVLLGNGLSVNRTFDASTGHLRTLKVGAGGSAAVVSLAYQYNLLGQLTQRQGLTAGLTQTFYYDSLGRIEQATLEHNGSQTQNLAYNYNAIGNLTSRTGVGSYHYDGAHPHAVTSITGAGAASYSYDVAGEMLSGAGRTYQWNAAGKPWKISANTGNEAFRYGPGGRIYREVRTDASGNPTIITTPGPYLRVIQVGMAKTLVNRVLVGSKAIALFKVQGTGIAIGIDYLHRDRLGSVVAVSNAAGEIVSRSAYGVWGQRVNPATWKGAPPDAGTLTATKQGYTSHKELAQVGLVHMGGRVYDPAIGRFVSADPTLQAPYAPQDLNRYSYVMNSPMNAIDPNGYSIWGDFLDPLNIFGDSGGPFAALGDIVDAFGNILGKIAPGLEHLAQEVKTYWKVIVAVGLAVVTAGLAAPLIVAYLATTFAITSAVATAALSAVVMGAVAGGVFGATLTALYGGSVGDILSAGFRGAAIGAFAGAATFGAGYVSAGWGFVGQAAAHGLAGGLTGVVAGGSFKKGFELAVVAYGAFSLYQRITGEAPSWKRGHGSVYKARGNVGDESQINNQFGPANITKDPSLVGTSVSNPLAGHEGSGLSNIIDGGPGINAVSNLHDVLGDVYQAITGGSYPMWYLAATIPPAALISYVGLINTPIGYGMVSSDVWMNNHDGP